MVKNASILIFICFLGCFCVFAVQEYVPTKLNSDLHSSSQQESATTSFEESKKASLIYQAILIQEALSRQDYATMTSHIHPTKGIMFPLSLNISRQEEKQFSREDFAKFIRESNVKFTWRDMGGEYKITLPKFLTSITGQHYDDATIAYNKLQINRDSDTYNIPEIFPLKSYQWVSFFNELTPEQAIYSEGYNHIVMVFEEYGGQSYLVAIIDDRWGV